MGYDESNTATIDETVAALTNDALSFHLVNYNGVFVHTNDHLLMPQGCPWCDDGTVHKHYHLWSIHEGADGTDWIKLALISQFAEVASFKEFCEAGSPFYYTCPVDYLDRVPEPVPAVPNVGPPWRATVRSYAKRTQRREARRRNREAFKKGGK